MYRSSDIIRFRFADPYLAGEKWADKPNCEKVVEIIINEREILEYFREIEATYRKEEGLDEEDGYSDYGHVSAKELYEDLHWIERENDYNKRKRLCVIGRIRTQRRLFVKQLLQIRAYVHNSRNTL